MKRTALISCSSKKFSYPEKAENLYVSPLFKMNLSYARSLNPQNIFILSAKYGLLALDRAIRPYDLSLVKMNCAERLSWADKVIKQLEDAVDLEEEEIIFLCGKNYRKYLIPRITNYLVPLEGLGIGNQLKYLKERV